MMYFASQDNLEPKDLALLRQVLDEVCAEKGIAVTHPDAEAIAHELINWWLFGLRTPEQLKSILKPLANEAAAD